MEEKEAAAAKVVEASDSDDVDDSSEDEALFEASSAPRLPKTLQEKQSQKRVIIVLQRAALDAIKTKQVLTFVISSPICPSYFTLTNPLYKNPK